MLNVRLPRLQHEVEAAKFSIPVQRAETAVLAQETHVPVAVQRVSTVPCPTRTSCFVRAGCVQPCFLV